MENNTEMKGNEMDSWDGFLGSNWLSVEDVKDENTFFTCIKIELDAENNRPMLILQNNENNENFYKLSLNITNANFVKDAGVNKPKDLIQKKIFFRKTIAFSPNAKKDVPTLRISKVE